MCESSRRIYKAKEINDMREAIRWYGFDRENSYCGNERAMEVETRLVTYLSQGIEPYDLISTLKDDDRNIDGQMMYVE